LVWERAGPKTAEVSGVAERGGGAPPRTVGNEVVLEGVSVALGLGKDQREAGHLAQQLHQNVPLVLVLDQLHPLRDAVCCRPNLHNGIYARDHRSNGLQYGVLNGLAESGPHRQEETECRGGRGCMGSTERSTVYSRVDGIGIQQLSAQQQQSEEGQSIRTAAGYSQGQRDRSVPTRAWGGGLAVTSPCARSHGGLSPGVP
jgi:hypothetical protein